VELPDTSPLPEGAHIVQLFDTADSLANALATFLCDGWAAGDWMLVLVRMRNWSLVSRRLRRRGFPIEIAEEQGRLIVLDAELTRAAIMHKEQPDREWFSNTIGRLVGRLWSASAGRLRIYGELVELLAEEGNFDAACRLEALWEELRPQYPFTLLCGYSAAHFADEANAGVLRRICQYHTEVRCQPADILGRWLLRNDRAQRDADG